MSGLHIPTRETWGFLVETRLVDDLPAEMEIAGVAIGGFPTREACYEYGVKAGWLNDDPALRIPVQQERVIKIIAAEDFVSVGVEEVSAETLIGILRDAADRQESS